MIENRLFKGMTALVTGASSGIGYSVAEELLSAGANVALHYHTKRERVEQLAAKYSRQQCLIIHGDFENLSNLEKFFSVVRDWRNCLDILINNAAWIEPVDSIMEVDEAILVKSFRVNSAAPFILSKLALQEMLRVKSGRIVTISSIGVKYYGSPQTAHYTISKAALEAGTLALAKTAAPDGILINVVRPGVTRTGAHERLGRTDMASREAMIPLKRAAQPDEIAKVVTFLVSPLNTYMTGCIIPVAGGE